MHLKKDYVTQEKDGWLLSLIPLNTNPVARVNAVVVHGLVRFRQTSCFDLKYLFRSPQTQLEIVPGSP